MRADRWAEKVPNIMRPERFKGETHQVISDAAAALLKNIKFQQKQIQCGTASPKHGKPRDACQTKKMHPVEKENVRKS